MKERNIKTAVASLIAAVAVAGTLMAGNAVAGIANTKHNLGTTGTGSNHQTAGTAELCVFCHTPHGADTSASVPLWNRVLAAPVTYSTYNSLGTSSLDGSTTAVGSVSIACLSCHDGVQAMDVMINQPGSGGFNAAGAAATGNVWSGSAQLNGATVTNTGVDLRNDHPIGVQYAGGPVTGTVPDAPNDYTTSQFKDRDFKDAKSAILNGKSVWWVETPGSGNGRQKTDMQLYTRTGALALGSGTTLNGDQPYVECASCHDPHSENPTFLRIANTGSAVCLACHTK